MSKLSRENNQLRKSTRDTMARKFFFWKFDRRWLLPFIAANVCVYIAELVLFIINDPVIGERFESVLNSTEAMWNIPLYVISAVILINIGWYFAYM